MRKDHKVLMKQQILPTSLTTIGMVVIITGFLFMILFNVSCANSSNTHNSNFDYGTKNDSARYYYHLGWEQILDKGQWTLAEASFRKAIIEDPDFLIGQSLVGRISSDGSERDKILNLIESNYNHSTKDERLLLDVFISSIRVMNQRNNSADFAPNARSEHLDLSKSNYKQFVKKYPADIHIKAEYLEVIHALHGPQATYDTINRLLSEREKSNPFILGFHALSAIELGKTEEAFSLANKLRTELDESIFPKPNVVLAQLYYEMDSLNKAAFYSDKALVLDGNHLVAKRLQNKINEQLRSVTN